MLASTLPAMVSDYLPPSYFYFFKSIEQVLIYFLKDLITTGRSVSAIVYLILTIHNHRHPRQGRPTRICASIRGLNHQGHRRLPQRHPWGGLPVHARFGWDSQGRKRVDLQRLRHCPQRHVHGLDQESHRGTECQGDHPEGSHDLDGPGDRRRLPRLHQDQS